MSETKLNATDLADAKNFLIQYLRDAGYEGSLEDGTALSDLLTKAMAILYTLFKSDVDRAEAYQSLAGALKYREVLGDEYDSAVDTILSNWFVTRKPGVPSVGTLRLVFAKPLDLLQIASDKVLAEVSGVECYPSQSFTYRAEDFVAIVNSVEYFNEYYLDIPVVGNSEAGAAIRAGDAVTVYLSNIYFLRARVVEDFGPGTTQESSEAFIERTQQAINTRELITPRAAYTVLMDQFDALSDLYVAGYGSAEQVRDLVTFENVEVHIGNKADIYLDAPLVRRSYSGQVDAEGHLTVPDQVAEVLQVVAAEEAPLEFSFVESSEGAWGTSEHTPVLIVEGASEGQEVTVTYLHSSLVEEVAAFIRSDAQRVACYDPWVRSKLPVVLSAQVRVRIRASASTETSTVLRRVSDEIQNYVRTRRTAESLVVSEMVSHLHTRIEDLYRVELPLEINYQVRDPETKELFSGVVGDVFELPAFSSKQASWNTLQFYTSPELLEVAHSEG